MDVANAKRWLEARKWVIAFAALGLIVRLGLVLARRGRVDFYDERDYDQIAAALASGGGFANRYGSLTAFRPPGQPFFMAAIYALFGHAPMAVLVAQAVLLTALPFLVARLAHLISERPVVSNGAAFLAALDPALAYASATLYPVTLTTLLLAGAVLASVRALQGEGLRWPAVTGILLSALALTTPYFAVLIAVMCLLLVLRRQWAAAALLGCLALTPLGAWMARNHAVLGTAALTTSGGYNLALGANDRATPRSGNLIAPDVTDIPAGEVDRDEMYRRVALSWIIQNPVRYAALAFGRAVCVLDSVGRPATHGFHDEVLARLVGWAMLPFVLLGLVGLWLQRKRWVARLTAAALGAVVLASAATLVKPRFRFPCDPLLAPFAMQVIARPGSRRAAPPARLAPAED